MNFFSGIEGTELVINCSPNGWTEKIDQIADCVGIGEIPRLFYNMRAKRESVWLRHSEKTTAKYFLMVTDDDYAVAAGKE